jgi:hypothetical protein
MLLLFPSSQHVHLAKARADRWTLATGRKSLHPRGGFIRFAADAEQHDPRTGAAPNSYYACPMGQLCPTGLPQMLCRKNPRQELPEQCPHVLVPLFVFQHKTSPAGTTRLPAPKCRRKQPRALRAPDA